MFYGERRKTRARMDNALLIGLQTQRVLQRRMDATANNLANVNTTGFKADEIVLVEADGSPAEAAEDPSEIRFVRDIALSHNFAQGTIAITGNDFDVALEGDGFFAIEGPNGPLYTRDGAFSLSADGTLVTSDGRAVLSSGGTPIVLDPQAGSPSIGRDGVVRANGVEVGRIGVVNFAQPLALEKVGENLWSAEGQPPTPFEGVVVQGALEGSNVQPVLELTRLLEISRAYQSAARIVSSGDELRKSAIERLGR